jgi:hypothetical protein
MATQSSNYNHNSNYNNDQLDGVDALLGLTFVGVIIYGVVTAAVAKFNGFVTAVGAVFNGIVTAAIFSVHLIGAVYYATFPSMQATPTFANHTAKQSTINEVNNLHKSALDQIKPFSNGVTLHPYVVDNRAFINVTTNSNSYPIEIPLSLYTSFYQRIKLNMGYSVKIDHSDKLAQNLDILRTIIAKDSTLSNKGPILVANGSLQNINYQEIFRDQLVFRSASLDNAVILNNLNALYKTEHLSPQNTHIINGIPNSQTELSNIKLNQSDWGIWQGVHQNWQGVIEKHKYTEHIGKTAFSAIEALKTQSNIVIIVAHSDSHTIYFPDGSHISVADIEEIKEQIKKNNPLVALFSCRTAQMHSDGLTSFSKALIDVGAKAVIAPVTEIGARTTSKLLDNILLNSQHNVPIEAIHKAIQETGIRYLENWIGYKTDFNYHNTLKG